MNSIWKPVAINLIITVAIALSICFGTGNTGNYWNNIFTSFGLVALGMCALNFLLGLFLLVTGQKQAGSGCLISAGILLLAGFSSCSQVKIHV